MKKSGNLAVFATLILAGSLLAACGNTDPLANRQGETNSATKTQVTISGAGASSQETAMNAWRAGYQTQHPEVQITYDGVGSGAGVEQFLSGQVAFAGTDKALKPEEIEASQKVCNGQQAINLPVYISPVAIVFKLDGVTDLQLSPNTVAKIFNGQVTQWNDPALAAENPQVTLPDLPITAVHRADKSGTTENFTAYLAAAAGNDWPYKPSKEWPVAAGESGDKTAGVIQAVQAGNGTIGYADASQVGTLGTVALKVKDGYVKYSAQAAGKAVAGSQLQAGRAAHDLALELDYANPAEGAYPLILVSYLVTCPGHPDAETSKVVADFLTYVASEEGQAEAAKSAGSAPLPAEIREKVTEAAKSLGK